MFTKTSNPYKFQYLITGITGAGIKEVYLPEQPAKNKILFKREQLFVRPQPSEQLKEWMDEFEIESAHDANYIHAHQAEINAWEEQEFERTTNGIWFWNDGVATYITGDHYKYLTQWEPLFGFPEYWETDKEVFYWIKFWEEDPESYGGLYNTCRRAGKSTKMGFWIMNRTSTNFKHLAGMQGEDNVKIKDFYEQMIIEPFYKLPYYSKPTYDTTTLQKKGIIFKDPPRRNKKMIRSKTKLVLESKMDYRTSEANKYDQAKLNSSVIEEPGKLLTADISQRWSFMKPCHELGKDIIGKSFWGTTVEFMDVTDKGGRAYKKVCFQSDYDVRTKVGRTISGLYAALMPADCVFQGCIDKHGRPDRKEALKIIMANREAVKDNPKDYSTLIRKYPLNWNEVFYISADKCEFNATILQDRRSELLLNPPQIRKVNLRWENNVRFSRVVMFDDIDNGWLKLGWLPRDDKEKALLNNVERYVENGITKYKPKNGAIFGSGVDPIDHGVVVEDSVKDNEFVSSRRSRPVQFVKRKYDSAIDGVMTPELLIERAKAKYPYKTNKYIAMADVRPNDPNVFFERTLMVCWLFGVPVKVESQKPGVINWFHEAGCDDFLHDKYIPLEYNATKADYVTKGTAGSPMMIQELTGAIATDVEYFGHTYIFMEMIEDDLVFDPTATKKFDYAMGQGWTEIGCKIRPKTVDMPLLDIGNYFRTFRKADLRNT